VNPRATARIFHQFVLRRRRAFTSDLGAERSRVRAVADVPEPEVVRREFWRVEKAGMFCSVEVEPGESAGPLVQPGMEPSCLPRTVAWQRKLKPREGFGRPQNSRFRVAEHDDRRELHIG
jgi:hypothetical protein